MSTQQTRFTSLADSLPPPTCESLVPTATHKGIDTEARLVSAVRTLVQRYRNRQAWRGRHPTEQSLAGALVRFHQFTNSELAPFLHLHWEPEHLRSWTTQQLVDWLATQEGINSQGDGSWTHFLQAMKVTGDQIYQTVKGHPDICKAIFDYTPEEPDELELTAGQLINIIKKPEGGWWFGQIEGTNNTGWFPDNFVQPASAAERQRPGKEQHGWVGMLTEGPHTGGPVQHLLNDGPYYNHRVAGHKLLGDILEEELARHFDQPTDRPLTNLDMTQGV